MIKSWRYSDDMKSKSSPTLTQGNGCRHACVLSSTWLLIKLNEHGLVTTRYSLYRHLQTLKMIVSMFVTRDVTPGSVKCVINLLLLTEKTIICVMIGFRSWWPKVQSIFVLLQLKQQLTQPQLKYLRQDESWNV